MRLHRGRCHFVRSVLISPATVAELEAQGIDYIHGVRERSTADVRSTVM
jgi:hypothetical protein